MMAALDVLKVVGDAADIDFVALEILPILWSMGLGPLLSLAQFQSFMELIRSLSRKVEEEHASKLQELSGPSNGSVAAPSEDFVAFGGLTGTAFDASGGGGDADDFEALVKGRPSPSKEAFPSWDANPPSAAPSAPRSGGSPQPPAFSWSTPAPAAPAVKTQQASAFRTVTPDLSGFGSLTPTSTQYSQPLQPQQPQSAFPPPPTQNTTQGSSVNWSTNTTSPTSSSSNPWSSGTMGQQVSSAFGGMGGSMNSLSLNSQRPGLQQSSSSLSLPPPPGSPGGLSLAPPPGSSGTGNAWSTQGSAGMGMGMGMAKQAAMNTAGAGMGLGMAKQTVTSPTNAGMGMAMNSAGSAMGGSSMGAPPGASQPKSGLDKYQSLL